MKNFFLLIFIFLPIPCCAGGNSNILSWIPVLSYFVTEAPIKISEPGSSGENRKRLDPTDPNAKLGIDYLVGLKQNIQPQKKDICKKTNLAKITVNSKIYQTRPHEDFSELAASCKCEDNLSALGRTYNELRWEILSTVQDDLRKKESTIIVSLEKQ